MDNTKEKYILIWHVMSVFFALLIAANLGLAGFRWVFDYQLHWINLPEKYWGGYIPAFSLLSPFISSWLCGRIWQDKHVLHFKDPGNIGLAHARTFFMHFYSLTILTTLMLSQNYLSTAWQRLEILDNIHDINPKNHTRYYKFKNFSLDLGHKGCQMVYDKSDQGTLSMTYYMVFPIKSSPSKNVLSSNKYWCGQYYYDFEDKVRNDQVDSVMEDFRRKCSKYLYKYIVEDSGFLALDHFERPPVSKHTKYLNMALANAIHSTPDESFIVLTPQYGPIKQPNRKIFLWILVSSVIGSGLVFLTLTYFEVKTNPEQ